MMRATIVRILYIMLFSTEIQLPHIVAAYGLCGLILALKTIHCALVFKQEHAQRSVLISHDDLGVPA